MSKYTTQLKNYLEQDGSILFDFDYPIFSEAYRPILEEKIINHYYFREIGLETIGQFKWFLKSKMNIIMPYYNELYESTGLITKDDYAINQNSVETHTKTSSTKTTGKIDSTADSTADTTNQEIYSDTPQGRLTGGDYATTTTENTTNAHDTTIGGSTSEGDVDFNESYTIELTGGGGLRYNADVLMEWRKSFINIDKMIIDELNDLFMNIY